MDRGPLLADFCLSKTPSVPASSDAHASSSRAQMMIGLYDYHTVWFDQASFAASSSAVML